MDNFLDKLNIAAKKNGMTVKKLIEDIEMTETGFYTAIRNNSLKTKTLERIATILKVPVSYFFKTENDKIILNGTKNIVGNNNHLIHSETDVKEIDYLKRENELLREIIETYKTQIQNKDNQINVLTKLLERGKKE